MMYNFIFIILDSLKKNKLEDYFFDKNVQSILKKITGLNYDKVFRAKQTTIEPDKFKFATEDQLKEVIIMYIFKKCKLCVI